MWQITVDLAEQTEGQQRATRFIVSMGNLEAAMKRVNRKLMSYLDGFNSMQDPTRLESFLVQLQIQEQPSPNSCSSAAPTNTSDPLLTRLSNARRHSSGDCSPKTPTGTEPSASCPPSESSE